MLRSVFIFSFMTLLLIALLGCASAQSHAGADSAGPGTHTAHHGHDEPTPFDKTRDAQADVNLALSDAKDFGKLGLIVMGANWCHDSRALAAHFEKPRFKAMIRSHYKLTYVDVGQKNRNLDIARQFGVETIVGTPTVFVTNSEGEVLNLDTAPTWRNAASRTEDEIWTYFRNFAHSGAKKTADSHSTSP